MYPTIQNINFEENEERLKVTLPVSRNWVLLTIYSIILLIGIILFAGGIIFGIQIATSGERFSFVFTVMIVIFLALLYPLLKYIFQQWQYHVTNREILFINQEELIIRRPVSILGITKTYDRAYIKPISYSHKFKALLFYYGSQPVLFANGLPNEEVVPIAEYLNERYFPDIDDEDE